MPAMNTPVTVIATVLNEAESIELLLHSLAQQTHPPDAIILVDGGSSDGTLERLREWEAAGRLPLRVIEAPGANIARGRNIAIAAAETALIATTDAGTRLAPDWLEHLLAPFTQDPPADVVAGFFQADPHTLFETALGATTLPLLEDIRPDHFLPSSRSLAFRKSVWQAVGGYPEWLDYCEDLLFDLWVREEGYRIVFAPKAIAYFRPRPTLKAFFQQYFRYARGDGKADLWLERHLIRYTTYLLAAPLLVRWALGRPQPHVRPPAGLARLALVAGAALMFRPPMIRLWKLTVGWPWRQRLQALAWVPLIRITGDVAKMLGYPAGRWWRRQHARELCDVRGRPPFKIARIFDRS